MSDEGFDTALASADRAMETVRRNRFRMFAGVWAVANLVHLANDGGRGFDAPIGWLNAFAAILLLLDTGSVRRLALLSIAQIGEFVWFSPFSADHQALAAAANAAILATILGCWLRNRQLPDSLELGPRIFPALRALLLIAYASAAIAKYNSTFLDPATSCAAFLADLTTFGLLGGDGALGHVHVLAAVGPETVIPILLVVPRTRTFGVRFAIGFHLMITVSPALVVGDFTMILTALFLLFASDSDITRTHERVRRRLDADALGRWFGSRRYPVLVSALSVGVLGVVIVIMGSNATFLAWAGTLATAPRLLLALVSGPLEARGAPMRLGQIALPHIAVCIVLFVWAMSPYLGLRTTGVFTMFSNLRTEGAGTNHLFMPSLHLTDDQNDLVVPTEASSVHFGGMVADSYGLTTFELRREIAADPSVRPEGTRNGVPIGENDREDFREPLGWFETKFFQFRNVPAGSTRLCTN